MFRSTFYNAAVALAMSAVLGLGASCFASIQLEFDDVTTQGGTVSYDGAGGALVGTDIIFDQVLGIGTPLNDGVALDIVGGLLDFTTGANTGLEGPPIWEFAGGGTFVLTGTVMDGLVVVASGTLLSGNATFAVAAGTGSAISVIVNGVDIKNQDLLDYYGITGTSDFGFANTEIATTGVTIGADGSFTATVDNADITNTQVPEATALLVWSGLIGVAGLAAGRFHRRRKD